MSGAWPCAEDARTLAGLAALRRDRPDDWHLVMRARMRRVGLQATVGEAMRLGGQGALLPEHARDHNRLKALRNAARLAVAWYGAVRLEEITEAWLRQERRRQAAEAEVSRDQASRCFTLLRRVALRAARVDRVPAKVRPRLTAKRRPRLAPPPERPIAEWFGVEGLMSDSQDMRVRCAVTLQAHVGAATGRVLGLRVGDIERERGRVWVRIPGPDGRLVREPWVLPADAMSAVWPWHRHRSRLGADALLFPMRGDPRRPTKSINRAIRRQTDRMGLEPVTMQSVRRLAQLTLRGLGATRAQVRGSRRVRPARRPGADRRLARQRRRWMSLDEVPQRLPLRAPRGCAADEPELRRRRRVPVRWPSTPVVRRPRAAVGEGSRRAAGTAEETPWAAVEAEVEERVRATGGPLVEASLPELPDLPAPVPVPVPVPQVHRTTVQVRGYSQAELDAAVFQGAALGVTVEALLRRFGEGDPGEGGAGGASGSGFG